MAIPTLPGRGPVKMVSVSIVAVLPGGTNTSTYRLKATATLEKVLKAWSKAHGVDVNNVVFTVGDRIIAPEHTPNSLQQSKKVAGGVVGGKIDDGKPEDDSEELEELIIHASPALDRDAPLLVVVHCPGKREEEICITLGDSFGDVLDKYLKMKNVTDAEKMKSWRLLLKPDSASKTSGSSEPANSSSPPGSSTSPSTGILLKRDDTPIDLQIDANSEVHCLATDLLESEINALPEKVEIAFVPRAADGAIAGKKIFRVKRAVPLGKVVDKWCKMEGIPVHFVKFTHVTEIPNRRVVRELKAAHCVNDFSFDDKPFLIFVDPHKAYNITVRGGDPGTESMQYVAKEHRFDAISKVAEKWAEQFSVDVAEHRFFIKGVPVNLEDTWQDLEVDIVDNEVVMLAKALDPLVSVEIDGKAFPLRSSEEVGSTFKKYCEQEDINFDTVGFKMTYPALVTSQAKDRYIRSHRKPEEFPNPKGKIVLTAETRKEVTPYVVRVLVRAFQGSASSSSGGDVVEKIDYRFDHRSHVPLSFLFERFYKISGASAANCHFVYADAQGGHAVAYAEDTIAETFSSKKRVELLCISMEQHAVNADFDWPSSDEEDLPQRVEPLKKQFKPEFGIGSAVPDVAERVKRSFSPSSRKASTPTAKLPEIKKMKTDESIKIPAGAPVIEIDDDEGPSGGVTAGLGLGLGAEPEGGASSSSDNKITLVVKAAVSDLGSLISTFKIKPNAHFNKAKEAWCKIQNVPITNVRFQLTAGGNFSAGNSHDIWPTDTPAKLMEKYPDMCRDGGQLHILATPRLKGGMDGGEVTVRVRWLSDGIDMGTTTRRIDGSTTTQQLIKQWADKTQASGDMTIVYKGATISGPTLVRDIARGADDIQVDFHARKKVGVNEVELPSFDLPPGANSKPSVSSRTINLIIRSTDHPDEIISTESIETFAPCFYKWCDKYGRDINNVMFICSNTRCQMGGTPAATFQVHGDVLLLYAMPLVEFQDVPYKSVSHEEDVDVTIRGRAEGLADHRLRVASSSTWSDVADWWFQRNQSIAPEAMSFVEEKNHIHCQ